MLNFLGYRSCFFHFNCFSCYTLRAGWLKNLYFVPTMKPFSDSEIAALTAWLDGRQDFVFLETSRVSNEDHRSFFFADPVRWLECNEPDQANDFIRETVEFQQQGYYLAGWIGYEFGYLLEPSLFTCSSGVQGPFAVLGVFKEPVIFDHQQDISEKLYALVTSVRTEPDSSCTLDNIRTNISKDEYLQAIDRIKKYIVAGDTYQVNYTFKLQFGFQGALSALYRSLRRNQSVSYGAWIRQGGRDIMSFSPELFFRADHEQITVRPMKGTMSRGRTSDEDSWQQKALHRDLKNRSENVMIVDLLRNDLGHFLHNTGGGKVRPRSLFDVEVYDTILQMTSTIEGIPAGKKMPNLQDILQALFPCGSVTGAPKIRTMEIIHELEQEPRGVYCGAVGFCSSAEAVFNVPIRTVSIEGGQGEMGVGSGIVYDSGPEAEWSESLLKGNFLTSPIPDFQLIETLLWQPDSGYWLFEEHKHRLTDSARYFLFGGDIEQVFNRLELEAKKFSSAMRVRLLLYKDGRVEISTTELNIPEKQDSPEPAGKESLPRVIFSAKQTDPGDVYLYHKTTERDLYTCERDKAIESGFHEILFTNTQGEVTEGSVTNIFIERNGRLLTPPIRSGLLDGTFRRFLVNQGKAVEKMLTRDDVLRAEAVYVGNSVRGLVRILVQDR